MSQTQNPSGRPFNAPRSHHLKKRQTHKRCALETLELRQMLSSTPISSPDLTFRVVDDAAVNIAYRYGAAGNAQGSSSLATADASPRGVVSSTSGDKTWVVDANRNVYVYNGAGGLLGSWSAGTMSSSATPEGITTDGNDIWIVDSKSDKMYRYAGAASRLSGSQSAASSFSLYAGNSLLGNRNPKDIATDGTTLWVVDDGARYDDVFQYSTSGAMLGSLELDSANKTPTGIAFDPLNSGSSGNLMGGEFS